MTLALHRLHSESSPSRDTTDIVRQFEIAAGQGGSTRVVHINLCSTEVPQSRLVRSARVGAYIFRSHNGLIDMIVRVGSFRTAMKRALAALYG